MITALAVTGLVASACSAKKVPSAQSPAGATTTLTPSGAGASSAPAPATTPAAAAAAVTITPAAGSTTASPVDPVKVAVDGGTLNGVNVKNAATGVTVKGTLSADKSTWESSEDLGYSKSYKVTAIATNPDGKRSLKVSNFTTLTPPNMTLPYMDTTGGMAIQSGATYGVGMVVNVHFDEAISDKAAAEKLLKVTTSPSVAGAWYWANDQDAHWRPHDYYKPGTKVTVTANVYGKEVSPGLYGQADVTTSFKIGAKHVSIADDNTHQVSVYFDNKLVRTMPTSMGQGGYVQGTNGPISLWTMSGVYTVIGHANPVLMDSSTYGLPTNSHLGYKENIYLATQISTDGIYLHELTSTIWAQGNTDVSHGCLNLNTANAQWFYDNSVVGDVVEVKNTGGPKIAVWQNGDWSVPWSTWVKGGAASA